MRAPLTERQNQVFEFIRTFIRENRKPPTLAEIGRSLLIESSNGVYKLLVALEKKGYIERTPRESRSIRVLEEDDPFAFDDGTPSLPLVSRTSSMQAADLRRRPTTHFALDPKLLGSVDPDRCLVGRVGDDGMSGSGIYKGDLVVVEEAPREHVGNGTLVAALVGEALLVRRYELANDRVHLRVSTRTYSDEAYHRDSDEVFVIGPVRTVMRRI